jgi:outer membrane lipoprotein-sorting protein
MRRRSLLALGALIPVLAAPIHPARAISAMTLTAADRADLARLQAYLDGLHTLKARFEQVAPDGEVSAGWVWLARPGRLRFEYDPPVPYLLIANQGRVIFEDRSINQVTEIPQSDTPLGLLLAPEIRLLDNPAVLITDITRVPGLIQVTMLRAERWWQGSLTLVFATAPLMLRQWVVLDEQRRETRVSLSEIITGIPIPDHLFDLPPPPAMAPGHR